MTNLSSFEKLLNDFKALNIDDSQPEQTFMQISGYPHYENVCSNLLSFFFDTEETHGFKDLFIRSLLDCIPQLEQAGTYRTEMVERECTTKRNNRIDIVLETESYVIGIENKLFHSVQNDLPDYDTYIAERAKSGNKEAVCILLSLKNNRCILNGLSFHGVTYQCFIKSLKKYMGFYATGANTKWLIFVHDFIKTIEGLQMDTKLDKSLVEFVNENSAGIQSLIDAVNSLSKSLKEKANRVKKLVSLDVDGVKQFIYCPQNKCYAEYYIELDGKQIEGQIVFDLYIDTEACYIIIGVRDDTDIQKKSLEYYLKTNGISSVRWLDSDVYLQLEKYSVFEPEESLAKRFMELLELVMKI